MPSWFGRKKDKKAARRRQGEDSESEETDDRRADRRERRGSVASVPPAAVPASPAAHAGAAGLPVKGQGDLARGPSVVPAHGHGPPTPLRAVGHNAPPSPLRLASAPSTPLRAGAAGPPPRGVMSAPGTPAGTPQARGRAAASPGIGGRILANLSRSPSASRQSAPGTPQGDAGGAARAQSLASLMNTMRRPGSVPPSPLGGKGPQTPLRSGTPMSMRADGLARSAVQAALAHTPTTAPGTPGGRGNRMAALLAASPGGGRGRGAPGAVSPLVTPSPLPGGGGGRGRGVVPASPTLSRAGSVAGGGSPWQPGRAVFLREVGPLPHERKARGVVVEPQGGFVVVRPDRTWAATHQEGLYEAGRLEVLPPLNLAVEVRGHSDARLNGRVGRVLEYDDARPDGVKVMLGPAPDAAAGPGGARDVVILLNFRNLRRTTAAPPPPTPRGVVPRSPLHGGGVPKSPLLPAGRTPAQQQPPQQPVDALRAAFNSLQVDGLVQPRALAARLGEQAPSALPAADVSSLRIALSKDAAATLAWPDVEAIYGSLRGLPPPPPEASGAAAASDTVPAAAAAAAAPADTAATDALREKLAQEQVEREALQGRLAEEAAAQRRREAGRSVAAAEEREGDERRAAAAAEEAAFAALLERAAEGAAGVRAEVARREEIKKLEERIESMARLGEVREKESKEEREALQREIKAAAAEKEKEAKREKARRREEEEEREKAVAAAAAAAAAAARPKAAAGGDLWTRFKSALSEHGASLDDISHATDEQVLDLLTDNLKFDKLEALRITNLWREKHGGAAAAAAAATATGPTAAKIKQHQQQQQGKEHPHTPRRARSAQRARRDASMDPSDAGDGNFTDATSETEPRRKGAGGSSRGGGRRSGSERRHHRDHHHGESSSHRGGHRSRRSVAASDDAATTTDSVSTAAAPTGAEAKHKGQRLVLNPSSQDYTMVTEVLKHTSACGDSSYKVKRVVQLLPSANLVTRYEKSRSHLASGCKQPKVLYYAGPTMPATSEVIHDGFHAEVRKHRTLQFSTEANIEEAARNPGGVAMLLLCEVLTGRVVRVQQASLQALNRQALKICGPPNPPKGISYQADCIGMDYTHGLMDSSTGSVGAVGAAAAGGGGEAKAATRYILTEPDRVIPRYLVYLDVLPAPAQALPHHAGLAIASPAATPLRHSIPQQPPPPPPPRHISPTRGGGGAQTSFVSLVGLNAHIKTDNLAWSAGGSPSQPTLVMCPLHPSEELVLYCMEEEELTCTICASVGRHSGRKCQGLGELLEGMRPHLVVHEKHVATKLAQTEAALAQVAKQSELASDSEERARLAIRRRSAELIEEVTSRCELMEQELNAKAAEIGAQLQGSLRQYGDRSTSLRTAHEKIKSLVDAARVTTKPGTKKAGVSAKAADIIALSKLLEQLKEEPPGGVEALQASSVLFVEELQAELMRLRLPPPSMGLSHQSYRMSGSPALAMSPLPPQ